MGTEFSPHTSSERPLGIRTSPSDFKVESEGGSIADQSCPTAVGELKDPTPVGFQMVDGAILWPLAPQSTASST